MMKSIKNNSAIIFPKIIHLGLYISLDYLTIHKCPKKNFVLNSTRHLKIIYIDIKIDNFEHYFESFKEFFSEGMDKKYLPEILSGVVDNSYFFFVFTFLTQKYNFKLEAPKFYVREIQYTQKNESFHFYFPTYEPITEILHYIKLLGIKEG